SEEKAMKDVGGFILIAALVMGLVSLGIVPLKEENKALKQQVSDLETELNQTQQRLIDVLMSNRN
ncbi:MAG: hypothetical protein SAJ72_24140, partial [Jaaginema sp. PMC 1080.18]|nr:hypothetical protein [Jaaginema sp. PMC 1080.18]